MGGLALAEPPFFCLNGLCQLVSQFRALDYGLQGLSVPLLVADEQRLYVTPASSRRHIAQRVPLALRSPLAAERVPQAASGGPG
jgi:hypothetical protein